MKVIESLSRLHPSKRANVSYSPQVSEAQLTDRHTKPAWFLNNTQIVVHPR